MWSVNFPDDVETFRMICKLSRWSGKFPDDMETFRMVCKLYGLVGNFRYQSICHENDSRTFCHLSQTRSRSVQKDFARLFKSLLIFSTSCANFWAVHAQNSGWSYSCANFWSVHSCANFWSVQAQNYHSFVTFDFNYAVLSQVWIMSDLRSVRAIFYAFWMSGRHQSKKNVYFQAFPESP